MTDSSPRVEGPYHTAINQLDTYLHSNELARQQGLKGGVVGATNLLSFADTLIEENAGTHWQRGARLRVRMLTPVYDQDRVRALLTVRADGDDFAADFVLERDDGAPVARGDGSLVDHDTEQLIRQERRSQMSEDLVGLKSLKLGPWMPPTEFPWFRCSVSPDRTDVTDYCTRNADRLASADRVPVAYLPRMLFNPVRWLLDAHGAPPGMYGALDIRQYSPLSFGVVYDYSLEVLAARKSAKYEILDVEMTAHDEAGALACAVTQTHLFPCGTNEH